MNFLNIFELQCWICMFCCFLYIFQTPIKLITVTVTNIKNLRFWNAVTVALLFCTTQRGLEGDNLHYVAVSR